MDKYVETRRRYRCTPNGLLRRIYARQKHSSKERNHPPPSYSFEEMEEWAFKNNFYQVYFWWKENNHVKYLTPSIDRLSDNKPYTLSNLFRVCTWEENKKRGETVGRVLARNGKAIKQLDKKSGMVINEYKSISFASKVTGVPATNICKVLKGKLKSAGGYKWGYV